MVYKFNSNSEFCANTYLVKKDNNAILIDAGLFSPSMKKQLENTSLNAILLTHGHFDHIKGLKKILQAYNDLELYAGEEKDFLKNPYKNGSASFFEDVSINKEFNLLEEGELIVNGFKVICYQASGHTRGGFIFYIKEEHAIFFGDTIIEEGIGRYDLYSASKNELMNTLEKIKYLDFEDDDICYFGHGDEMSFKELKLRNLYIK